MSKWQAVGNEVWESHADGDYLVCTCQRPGHQESDARLIADAPAMHEFLVALHNEMTPTQKELVRDVLALCGIDIPNL